MKHSWMGLRHASIVTKSAADGVDITSVDPTTGALKHVETYDGLWTGYNRVYNATAGGRWSWFDTNGDGLTTENEITRYIPLGQNSGTRSTFCPR